jgi:hypothetical protein
MSSYETPNVLSERLLQFIWQFQYFNKQHLTTTDEEPLQVLQQGVFNTNQGPDFLQAKIRISNTIWVGNIELHLLSSQWDQHGHSSDAQYGNIILHVVWQNDTMVKDCKGNVLHTLELQSLVSVLLLQHYQSLLNATDFVACAGQLPVLSAIGWLSWKERLLAERLERKTAHVLALLEKANNHWEEVFWWMLARNFGVKVNMDLFEEMAATIPITTLARQKNQIHQLEAIILGQLHLLDGDYEDDYAILLQKEYRFLHKKYQFKAVAQLPVFLRMRPANFPTIRAAQLAMLVWQSSHLFSLVRETYKLQDIQSLFNVTANDYWHYHYRFDEAGEYFPKKLGLSMVNNIVINTLVPVLFAYGTLTKDQALKDKALYWLAQIPPEQNAITSEWKRCGMLHQNAFDSQALIELKNNYCKEKRCLDCAVGHKLLKRES